MKYHQITLEERIAIGSLRKEGLSASAIAKRLGRHRSSITREPGRNRSSDGRFRHRKAQEHANARRRRSRRGREHSVEQYCRVNELLAQKYSPEQICGHLRRFGEFHISHETIYRHVWADLAAGGGLYLNLRQSPKQRRKRYRSHDSRGRLAHKRMIDERPASIDTRRWLGHWEIDTVMGRGDRNCIVTLVERKSGYLIIGKLRNRTKEELNACVIQLIKLHPRRFKTITADNGTEFHGYADIEEQTGVTFYFATPNHSWERGTNEYTNGLIRQYLPKGKSMASLTQLQCNQIARELNTRPRKRFCFKTPQERFYGLCILLRLLVETRQDGAPGRARTPMV